MSLDLKKAQERKNLVLDLAKDKAQKAGFKGDISAQVVLVMDYSGSMSSLYHRGVVQDTVERILPMGLAFDIDRQVDFFLFHESYIELPETLTTKNTAGYINDKIINKYPMGSTNYAPIINRIVDKYANKKEVKSGGWFGGLIGGKSETSVDAMEAPVYVIFITDGDNFDKYETEAAIKEASKYGIFFKFIGIGTLSFDFLQKIDDMKGRVIDNADFKKMNDLSKKSDEDLYSDLLDEFPSWLKNAQSHGMIK